MVDGGEAVGNSFGESCVGRERDGSDDRVDGGEIVGNSLERVPRERRRELRWRERDGRAWAGRVARVFRDNFN